MEALIRIAVATGKPKYLEPVARALPYLKKSLLPDGRLARFYELKTNKPLYMDAQYKLTYDDSGAPSHYGWKQPSRLDRIGRWLAAVREGKDVPTDPRAAGDLEREARKVLEALDDQGRWVSVHDDGPLVGQPKFARGFAYLSSAVFSRNVEVLSEFIAGKAK